MCWKSNLRRYLKHSEALYHIQTGQKQTHVKGKGCVPFRRFKDDISEKTRDRHYDGRKTLILMGESRYYGGETCYDRGEPHHDKIDPHYDRGDPYHNRDPHGDRVTLMNGRDPHHD